jgi:hypothetical protein
MLMPASATASLAVVVGFQFTVEIALAFLICRTLGFVLASNPEVIMRFVASAVARLRASSSLDPSRPGSAGRANAAWRPAGRAHAAFFAPLLGYWVFVGVLTIDPQIQWSLAIFGPLLVLAAWLSALRRGEAPTSRLASVRRVVSKAPETTL